MKTILSFFKLIRWPNLLFIILTQILFYHCIAQVWFSGKSNLNFLFNLLVLASVCIAAAGYIINDYFDLQIDTINKPEKIFIDKNIKRRWAIVWHLLLSLLGVLISFYISYKTSNFTIAIGNTATVLLLWFYSTHFKKKLLIGNVLIALLSAWVIIVVYFFKGATLFSLEGWDAEHHPFNVRRFFKLTALYAGFAFIVTLIREALKDMEDSIGDAQFNCKTMPIVWGIPATKVFTGVWIIVCCSTLLIVQVYAWQIGWWISAVYSIAFMIIPLLYLLKKLRVASLPRDYHQLSTHIKWVMLAGILSMFFFNVLP